MIIVPGHAHMRKDRDRLTSLNFEADSLEEAEIHKEMLKEMLVLERYKEEQKTKRLWLVLAVVAVLVSLILITFAPDGRETLSYWIGGVLLIFAAGAAGYKRVWGKSKLFEVGADQDKRDL